MRKNLLRAATVGFAAALIGSGAAAVSASAEETSEVEVSVEIESIADPGTLALSIESASTQLTESESSTTARQFVGTLPNVSVTDTRTMDEAAEGNGWYVLGSASDFLSSDGEVITADHFGWSPQYVNGDDEGGGIVSVGGDVQTVLDGDRGLVDQELLYLGEGLPAVEGGGRWTANADLFLRVPTDVVTGAYRSTVTLSLFE